jgi:4-amino-4-deoxy-L-arabinose transferase-like glycosyltransferase
MRPRWPQRLITLGLVGLLFAQLVASAAVKSPVFDEPANHLMLGYIVWRTGDWWLQREHPPLLHLLSASTLFLLNEHPDPRELAEWNDPTWRVGTRWPSLLWYKVFEAFPYPPSVLFFPARLVVIILTVLFSLIISRWACQRYGTSGGLIALFWLTLSPNWLAHGRLVTTDWIAAALLVTSLLVFHHSLHHPSLKALLLSGVTLGLGLGAKTSVLLAIPLLLLLTLAHGLGIRDMLLDLPSSIQEGVVRLAPGSIRCFLVIVLVGHLSRA